MRLVLAMLALVGFLAPRPGGARQFINICGDADDDAHITVNDGVIALRAAAELPSSCTLAICDVNGDGAITVADAVNILRNAAVLPAVVACRDVSGDDPTVTPRPVRTVAR
jgi:hypothetical protein